MCRLCKEGIFRDIKIVATQMKLVGRAREQESIMIGSVKSDVKFVYLVKLPLHIHTGPN